ncbi:hypothetical protein AOLI_G00299140 [Acnodon oligacanthus]
MKRQRERFKTNIDNLETKRNAVHITNSCTSAWRMKLPYGNWAAVLILSFQTGTKLGLSEVNQPHILNEI